MRLENGGRESHIVPGEGRGERFQERKESESDGEMQCLPVCLHVSSAERHRARGCESVRNARHARECPPVHLPESVRVEERSSSEFARLRKTPPHAAAPRRRCQHAR